MISHQWTIASLPVLSFDIVVFSKHMNNCYLIIMELGFVNTSIRS